MIADISHINVFQILGFRVLVNYRTRVRSPGPTSPAAETRLGSTYFRRDEVWGSPGGHEPPASVRAGSVVVFLGLLLPAPRLPCPSRAALPVCREVLVANAAWHRLAYYSPARPPASRPQGTASAPPVPRRRGRRDPRPRPLPSQSFGGGGKCPGSGAASGGSGRARFPPSSSSPPYRLPPPPLLQPRSPWGCSPAARKSFIERDPVLHPCVCQILEKENCLLLGEAIEWNASLLFDSYPWSTLVQMFHQKVSIA
ncbi:uncharacterized protein LOC123784251 [Ursus americanus]|uniref:uncharacterized protein LOC123784251 n=1 Tax=Ursus americanus TaxID=9643 RepID=UPI001E67C7D8|nr:uncharacterized protein LOC123784251 [Ursus americanus]